MMMNSWVTRVHVGAALQLMTNWKSDTDCCGTELSQAHSQFPRESSASSTRRAKPGTKEKWHSLQMPASRCKAQHIKDSEICAGATVASWLINTGLPT